MPLLTLDGPETMTLSDLPSSDRTAGAPVERDARLLVAGDYPGKGLHVTEADIDALVTNFSGPIPVKVEHIDSPLDPLGQVVRVWRDGAELRGRVSFPAAMASFLRARGAAKLSCGLLGEPAWRLLETSLTLRPHVPTATLLSTRRAELSDTEAAELVRLRAERLEAQITALKAGGRLVPAAEGLARALLTAPAVVTLSEGAAAEPVGEVFRKFLEAQPPVVRLAEMARGPGPGDETQEGLYGPAGDFSAQEKEVLRRLGVEPAAVARTMRNDAMAQDAAKKGGL